MKISVPQKRRIETLADIFDDPSIRSIAVVADVNQGKTNVLNALIKAIKARYDASVWASGLRNKIEGVHTLNSVAELEVLYNSVVIVDEFPDFYDITNKRQQEMFEKSVRKIFHSNNLLIICGLPRNFNTRLGSIMQAVLFKQSTLNDFIQRSPMEKIIKSFSSHYGSLIQKGSDMLTMPLDLTLYHEVGSKHWWELEVPYVKEGDAKKDNPLILQPKIKAR